MRGLIRIAALAMALGVFAQGYSEPKGRLTFSSYGMESEMKGAAVRHMLQDKDGFIWLATVDGLNRFDGHQFDIFDMKDGLPSNRINTLHQSPDGTLWVGTTGGLAYVKDGRFHSVDPASGLPKLTIYGMATDPAGSLWVATSDGLYRHATANTFEKVNGWPGGQARSVAISSSGEVWVTFWSEGRGGVLQCSGSGCRSLKGDKGFENDFIEKLAVDSQGTLWAMSLKSIWIFNRQHSRFERYPLELPPIITMIGDHLGRIWIGTAKNVVCLDHGRVAFTIEASEGLPTMPLYRPFVDREGSLWVGGYGIHRIRGGGAWRTHDTSNGLPNPAVWSFAKDDKGRMHVGTGDGLAVASSGSWKLIPGTKGVRIRTVVQGPDKALYMAGNVIDQILRYDPTTGQVDKLDARNGLYSDGFIFRLCFDKNGQLWVATEGNGLLLGRLQNSKWSFQQVQLPGGSKKENIQNLATDKKDRLWALGVHGPAVLDNGTWRRFTTKDGLKTNQVGYLLPDSNGDLVGAYSNGLGLFKARYEGGRLQNLQSLDSAFPVGITAYMLGEDGNRNLWVGTGSGLYRLSPDHKMEHFTVSTGIPNNDINNMAFLAEPNGDVWIGTGGGIAKYHEALAPTAPAPPATRIVTVKLGENTYLFTPAHQLNGSSSGNQFEVRFSTMHFGQEEGIIREVRLLGLDDKWHEATTLKDRYSNLLPGKFSFQVRSRIGSGQWGPAASVEFTIPPAWWQTWWFRTISAIAGAGLVYLLVRLRLRAVYRHNKHLEELVQSRTVALQEAMEKLRDQSLTDPLTGLRNRRFLDMSLSEDIAQVLRYYSTIARGQIERMTVNVDIIFLMVDLDHFKEVNDTYGHAAGDLVLQQMREILTADTRDTDTVVRWGGEEFLIVGRNACRADAWIVSERIRASVENHAFDIGNGKTIRMTCSVGVAVFPFQQASPLAFGWHKVIDIADLCLYAAKRSGRNAWVGLMTTPSSQDYEFPADIAKRVPEFLASGKLEVHASVEDTSALSWE